MISIVRHTDIKTNSTLRVPAGNSTAINIKNENTGFVCFTGSHIPK